MQDNAEKKASSPEQLSWRDQNTSKEHSLSRRTVITGSAWAVPAILVTLPTPAYATSGTTLAFDRSSYSGTGCSTITGVTITAQSQGAGKAGVSITATLSGGYTFSGGSTSTTVVTDSSGSVTLPAVNVPAAGGSATISATSSGSASASAQMAGVDNRALSVMYNGSFLATPGVPAGSTPIWTDFFLTPDNRLLNRTGTVWGSGIAAVGNVQYNTSNGDWTLGVATTSNGVGVIYNGNWLPTPGVPSGSKPVWSDFFLTPDNRLINRTGTVWGTGVATVGRVGYNNSGDWTLGVTTTSNGVGVIYNGNWLPTPGVPSGSKPVWSDFFLTPDNRLINRTGTVWGTGIATVGAVQFDNSGNWTLGVSTTSGGVGVLYNGNWLPISGVPSGSTPVWSDFFLTPDHRLMNRQGTSWAGGIAVVGAVQDNNATGDWTVGLKTDHC